MIDAAAQGAVVLNHARVEALTFGSAQGPADGAEVLDALGGSTLRVKARLVVNCIGPWTDEITRLENPEVGPAVRGTVADGSGEPIGGVAITVSDDSGFSTTVVTADDGTWSVSVPSAGTYLVSLDPGTLPDGVELPRRSGTARSWRCRRS